MYINILWQVIYGTIISWKKLVVSFFMDSRWQAYFGKEADDEDC